MDGLADLAGDAGGNLVQGQAGDGAAVDLQDDVAGADAGQLGRGTVDGGDDDGLVVTGLDFDADAGEFALDGGAGLACFGTRKTL